MQMFKREGGGVYFFYLNICYAGVNVALAKRLTGCKVLGAGNQ